MPCRTSSPCVTLRARATLGRMANPPFPRKTLSPRGFALIKAWEGIMDGDPKTVNLDPYLDPVGIWTIGWGHAIRLNGRFLKGEADRALAKSLYPQGITMERAEEMLREDVAPVEIYLSAVLPGLNQNEFDALVCFIHWAGLGNFESSTMFKLLKAGDKARAAGQFSRWVYSEGQFLQGLANRRASERALFLSPVKA